MSSHHIRTNFKQTMRVWRNLSLSGSAVKILNAGWVGQVQCKGNKPIGVYCQSNCIPQITEVEECSSSMRSGYTILESARKESVPWHIKQFGNIQQHIVREPNNYKSHRKHPRENPTITKLYLRRMLMEDWSPHLAKHANLYLAHNLKFQEVELCI